MYVDFPSCMGLKFMIDAWLCFCYGPNIVFL